MNYEYKVMGKTVRLEPDEDVVAVRFAEPAAHSTRLTVSAASGLGAFQKRIEIPGERFTIIPVGQTPVARNVRRAAVVKSLEVNKAVTRVAPVFKVAEKLVVATDRILVGFTEKATKVEETLEKLNCDIVEHRDREYLVRLAEDACPFKTATQLTAMNEVEYAEPDFVTIGKHIAQRAPAPNVTVAASTPSGDPMLSQQYATKITKAVEAWNFQVGDPSIKIAILDEGVDTPHADLKDAIVGTYDGIDKDSFQEPNTWDAHGTCCAGLAAAVPNNETGIRGIGGGCSLLAIRIAYSRYDGGDWVTSNSVITRSIDWAWKNGASVLSNSWGGGSESTAIIKAFERARTLGRDGKGCVILIAAGNDSGSVHFPGNLPNVLTVSASNEFDQFKTKTSSDGEYWWGSNFGPEVDVSAPGVHNLTTDISGAAGYHSTDYAPNFNGTSSSTPIVAGVVGLVLSANNELTEPDVRNIIKDTADKVGSLPYVNGRNDQFGNGRVNALRAVQQTQKSANVADIQGVILAFESGGSKGAAFFLQTTTGEVFLLRHYTGEEGAPWSVIETQSLAYLSQFVDSQRTVSFTRRQNTASGPILWGVSVK